MLQHVFHRIVVVIRALTLLYIKAAGRALFNPDISLVFEVFLLHVPTHEGAGIEH